MACEQCDKTKHLRERFEAWLKSIHCEYVVIWSDERCCYSFQPVQLAWAAWRADRCERDDVAWVTSYKGEVSEVYATKETGERCKMPHQKLDSYAPVRV
jgi:hypothetical protein